MTTGLSTRSLCEATSDRGSLGGRPMLGRPPKHPMEDLFYADIAEVVHTHLNVEATKLVVEWWTSTHGLRRIERE